MSLSECDFSHEFKASCLVSLLVGCVKNTAVLVDRFLFKFTLFMPDAIDQECNRPIVQTWLTC